MDRRVEPATSAGPMVRLARVSKRFGPVTANDDITLSLYSGRIKALLGENGAGKSTLMSLLAGKFMPDSGFIEVDGQPQRFRYTGDAIRAGIGMVYQHFTLVEAMTVAENVFLGQEGGFFLTPRDMERRVTALSHKYGLPVSAKAKVFELSMGEKQRVEILKLLHRKSRVLILDEPTAVLTPRESNQLFEALRHMASRGKSVVFISHKLPEVLNISDEIAVLKKGRIVAEMDRKSVTSPSELARLMVGRDVLLSVDRPKVPLGQTVLSLENLRGVGFGDVSLEVKQGEIVAVVGVAGNGQKPMVETVCGLKRPRDGWFSILSRDSRNRGSDFFDGLSYIPEDRLGIASCPNLDVLDNFLLTNRRAFTKGPWLQRQTANEACARHLEAFNVHPARTDILARRLSGGNLQKMVLARELSQKPRLIVAEQPTQGLDIAATEEVWSHLLAARQHAGILLVTSGLDEALTLADRVAVMFEGGFVDVFSVDERAKVEAIGPMMAGVKP